MASELLTGCVKWFNHNLNYGFITVLTDGEYNKCDIFVHQSNIKTKNECYRTLSPGECVQFEIAKSDNTSHPINAVNVSGFNGGMLNCENARLRNLNGGGNRSNEYGSEYRGRGRGRGHGHSHGSGDSRSYNEERDINNHLESNKRQKNNNGNNRSFYNNNITRQPYITRSNSNLEETTINNTHEINNESVQSVVPVVVSTTGTTTDIESLSSSMETLMTTKPVRGRGRGRGRPVSSN